MSKLKELAQMLKDAKKRHEPVTETDHVIEQTIVQPEPEHVVDEPVVEEVAKPVPVAPVPVVPAPVVDVPHVGIHFKMLQQEVNNLRKIVEQSAKAPAYNTAWMHSGGGADSTANIDRPVKTVTSNYTPTTRDWYIGVNHTDVVTITLPTNVTNGREYVIKDESGYAHLVPIRISGTIDNDPDGVEIRFRNGSITFLYNNGWRII